MALHGRIDEFDGSREDWPSYTERLEQYFAANDVDDADKRRAILLSACGASTYKLIRSLVAPAKPTDHTYSSLVQLVRNHYMPKPSVIVQRYRFNTRVRQQGETVAAFVTALRQLTEHCNFGATLEDMLRDRLVCGINDARLQRRLLAEPDLTFQKALDIALAMESADRNAQDLQQPRLPVHVVRRKEEDRKSVCYRCGGDHLASGCRFKEAECRFCKKKGHIARVCRSKAKTAKPKGPRGGAKPDRRSQEAHVLTDDIDDDVPAYTLFHLSDKKVDPLVVTLQVNKAELPMEIDTGASVSIISEQTYRTLWPTEAIPTLQGADVTLRTYSGEELDVLGAIAVTVVYQGQEEQLRLLVVSGDGPSLLGRDWLAKIKLNWRELHQVQSSASTLQDVLQQYSEVFKDELGTVRGAAAKILVDPQATPRFCRPRTVPYALRGKVEMELERLEREGVIERVEFSDWAAPIVPIVKKDGSIRICGDYKMTVNRAAKVDPYPLPRIDDLLASLSGGTSFSKLDLAHAYQQLPLEEDSKKLVTINTHRGLYRYTRMPFGVASAPAIFQRTMENLLQGLPRVCVYIDDILVTGESEADHLRNLEEVLKRLDSAGVRLKKQKCSFLMPEVEYLGHKISASGLQPAREKVRAIVDAPAPQNVSQLKSFLGLINYYGKFLPNLSTTLAPSYLLLQKASTWCWGPDQQRAFDDVRASLTTSQLLVHYDGEKKLVLACDASPYGVGAVLSHRMDDGADRPIAFASRTLSPAEKRYAQIDKKGLAIVFGVKKFHHYLSGRQFTIYTDHKPLIHLFSSTRPVPPMAAARIQRWALTLSAYEYHIEYRPGKDHANADVFSRLPLPESPADVPLPGETVLLMEHLQSTPVTAAHIKSWTSRDPILARVRTLILQGWRSSEGGEELRPYLRRRDELSVQDGCVLWGNRVIVPPAGCQEVMNELHDGHPGIVRMKALARSYVWWPGMDGDLEEKVKSCPTCQYHQHCPAQAPLHPWEWPKRPWSRIHADYAGPFMGKMFLVLVDAHSKWLEVHLVNSATSLLTIERMRSIFATHGLPEMLVTDNGSVFTSAEFEGFLKQNGIRHVKSAPYHPASNGLAERAVQTFKASLQKSSSGSLETKLARFLFKYRVTPHSTTGLSPAELLMGRRLQSHLDLLHPDLAARVRHNQEKQKIGHDLHSKSRTLEVGDPVFVRDFGGGSKWLAGVLLERRGPVSFTIRLEDGRLVRRHVDHIRIRQIPTDAPLTNVSPPETAPAPDFMDDYRPNSDGGHDDHPALEPRRSGRTRRPPERYM